VKFTDHDEDNFPNSYRVLYIKGGAAMTLTRSSVVISDCTFVSNHAQMGSAIFSELYSNISLSNTIFEQNFVICSIGGGGICGSGVLYSGNGTVLAYNSTFHDNKISILYNLFPHGGVFGLFDSVLIAENCHFIHNGPNHYWSGHGGAIHGHNSTMNISNCNFVNNSNASYGGAVSISNAICFITHSNFTRNSAYYTGGAIYSEKASLIISNSVFFNTTVATTLLSRSAGGVLYISDSVLYNKNDNIMTIITNSVFEDNKGAFGGVIAVVGDVYLDIVNCNFSRNHAINSGGVIHMESEGVATIIIASSLFSDNSAEIYGGGMVITNSDAASNVTLNGIQFSRNTASEGGALCIQEEIPVLIRNSTFVENSAEYGGAIICATVANVTIEGGMIDGNMARIGVIFAKGESFIDLFGTVITNNTANRAIVYITQSVGYLSDITLTENTGSIFVYFGNLTLSGNTIITNGSPQSNSNKTISFDYGDALIIFPEGGAITTVQANVAIEGMCSLSNNYAANGGAMYATESRIHIYGAATINNNIVSASGGGIYLHQSGLICYRRCIFELVNNTSGYKGGGIYATSSSISAENEGQIIFRENVAAFAGGAFCAEQNSKLYILMIESESDDDDVFVYVLIDTLIFSNNSANYGGAVYVSDGTNSGTCASGSYQIYSTKTECFFQVLSLQSQLFERDNIAIMSFANNHAYISGSDLFGGLLDRCIISPLAEKTSEQPLIIDGASYFFDVSNIDQLDTISSDPVRICFCNEDKQPECGYRPPVVNVKKGETFTVSLVAVDQVKKIVSNATIRSSLSSSFGGLGENRQSQTTGPGENCTDLMFEVFSPNSSEQLILYADGPCKDAPLSQGRININFSSCDCPIGFQQKLTTKARSVCECECDSDLHPYVSNCDPEAETITREGDFWVDYIKSDKSFLVHPHCPYDYCKPSDEKIALNLNHDNITGADAQCANKRSGLLCAQCSFGTSLSIGSSYCIQCPTYWPLLTIILLIISVLAGILLIGLILSLNLTVAVGTLNGVIFYANVVAASTNSVFPPNVIIAWLNLEPGINICFFNGLITYWKTWLQLAFPAYLIFLIALVILISDRSKRFSKLIGKKDPVATLATLLLFSYAKFLHTIIASLSGTVLKYPRIDGTHDNVVVWLPDATIRYLSGKHVPLFIVAILILLAGAAYTTILFSWQWLLRFKLFNHTPKLSLFIRAYHAPYTPRHRYWTGLLLIARIILYIIFAANIEGDPKINLIAIGVVVMSILIVRDFVEGSCPLYQKRPIEMVEIACHYNLVILCIVSFFTLQNESAKNVFAQISMSFTIILLLCVLLYHFFTVGVLKSKLWKRYKRERERRHLITSDTTEPATVTIEETVPSCSVVEAPKQPSVLLRGRKGGRMSSIDGACDLRETLLDQ
jgi:predicted outer membrane repeat protein